MLTKDIPPGEIWVGNPAKFMKKNVSRIAKMHVSNLEEEIKRYEDIRLHR